MARNPSIHRPMNRTERENKIETMKSMAESFVEIEVPQQKKYSYNEGGGGVRFPTVLSPPPAAAPTIQPLTDSIRTHKQLLESLLLESGALLFRGFPVNTPSDFNDVVEAFGYQEFPYVGGVAPRTRVVGRVFTANESPPDQDIAFHHEMAFIPGYPSKLFFFCEVEPGSGGETPIVESHVVYDRMKEKHPEFVERLEKHGLLYTRVLGEHDDPSSPIGRGWKSTFSTTDRTIAQQRAAKLGMKLEWLEDGSSSVKTIVGPVGGVKYDERRGRSMWFNSMVGWDDPAKPVTFGDGEPIPLDIAHDCLRILDDECVAIPWRKGDVLLIDNSAVLHARRSCHTPRRVLASLCCNVPC